MLGIMIIMPQPSTPISRQMAALGIPHNAAAPYVGVTVNWMWDLSSYPDEAWNTLSLVQLCRLLILLSLEVNHIVPDGCNSSLPGLECQRDQQGVLQVAGALRIKFGEHTLDTKKCDWDTDDIKRWLSDDEELADIPVPALHDICKLIGIDTCSAIYQYLTKLGRPTSGIVNVK
jgi:hypothetical protein